jgi:transposase InsO family protein
MRTLVAEYSLAGLCAAFGMSRSGYHAWQTRPTSAQNRLAQALHQRPPRSRVFAPHRLVQPIRQGDLSATGQRGGAPGRMSRAGNCCDNTATESFWSRLKTELVHRLAIFEYVEVFYNRVRLHIALDYKSSVDFGRQLN